MDQNTHSMLAFGAVAPWPSPDQLEYLQAQLRDVSLYSPLISTMQNLTSIWRSLTDRDEVLQELKTGNEAVRVLAALVSGDSVVLDGQAGNILTMPITTLSHIIQYCGYLEHFGQDADQVHTAILSTASRGGGIQGLCAGLLSALAVASGQSRSELVDIACTSLRLAFCIGAYIDLDEARSGGFSPTSALAIRWKDSATVNNLERILQKHQNTYISIVRDIRDITVTTPSKTVAPLRHELARHGALILDAHLAGRYHSQVHSQVPSKIMRVCAEHIHSHFGDQNLVRSNTDGLLISRRHAAVKVLESILVYRAEWYTTISSSASMIKSSTPQLPSPILAIGVDAVPLSVSKEHSVTKLKTLGSKPTTVNASQTQRLLSKDSTYPSDAIAVIGMSGRFPGANSIDKFWDVLSYGKSMLSQVPEERWCRNGAPSSRTPRGLKFWGNFLDDIDQFDHKLFKRSSRESASMDPQQRLLLTTVYEALESSAYFADPMRPRDIGCYIGACSTDYDANVGSHPATAYSTTGTLRAFLSGRISHHFGWSGPSLVFDTACSSSAVAIHTACVALQQRECSQAIAGGVTLITSPYLYENLATAHFLSPTGASKPFDAAADGYCRGEGVGVVILKRLDDAIAARDNILGVIAGSAVNQNSNCVSITVPHADSQSHLYAKVARQAGIETEKLTFVEAHGTGTPVGDPIEMESIRKVFGGSNRLHDLIVSSVKGNIGHLEGASGVAAMIKALLQMQYRTNCMQASFQSLNPKITSLAIDRVVVPKENQSLPPGVLTACVNNYGAAGSNAALILVERPAPSPLDTIESTSSLQRYPIHISAATDTSFVGYCRDLCEYVATLHQDQFADLAFSLARQQNQELSQMLTTTCTDLESLTSVLNKQIAAGNAITRPKANAVVLCFGGQIGKQIGLSNRAWQGCALLRFHLDLCDQTLHSLGYPSIYPAIFQKEPIEDVLVLQSAIFSLQYACARAWIDSGLRIDGLVGHSFGQLTALCISGGLSLRDGLRLVAGRATLMKNHWGSEPGVMIAVEADLPTIKNLLTTTSNAHVSCQFEIACHNGSTSHVVVTDKDSAQLLLEELRRSGTRHKRLNVTHGFHSRFTDPLMPPLQQLASSLEIMEPKIHLETCTTGSGWAEITPQLIAAHTRDPVFFGEAVQRLQDRLGACTFLEAGSDSSITSMVRRVTGSLGESASHNYVPCDLNKDNSLEMLADSTVKLLNHGHQVQFWNFHREQRLDYKVLRLPLYHFEKHRHWMPLRVAPFSSASPDEQQQQRLSGSPILIRIRPTKEGDESTHFDIDLSCQDLKDLCNGHVALGDAVLPPSGYIELVFKALKLLGIHSRPSIQHFQLERQVGAEIESRSIALSLQNFGDQWTFTFAGTESGSEFSTTYATGSVSGQQHFSDLERYQRLVATDKFDAIRADLGSTNIAGPILYRIFSDVAKYPTYFSNVQNVASNATHIVGRVVAPNSVPKTLQESMTLPHLLESFFQVPLIYCNCIWEHSPGGVYWLSSIEQLKPGVDYPTSDCRVFDVLCFVTEVEQGMSCDTFVYNNQNGALFLIALGMRFTRVSRSASEKGVSSLQEAATHAPLVVSPESEVLASNSSNPQIDRGKTITGRGSATVVSKATSGQQSSHFELRSQQPAKSLREPILEKVTEIFERIAEVPRAEVKGHYSVEDLGVDSLMMMEVVAEWESAFKLELPLEELMELRDVDSLVGYLKVKIHRETISGGDSVDSRSTQVQSDVNSTASTTTTTPPGSPPRSPVADTFSDPFILGGSNPSSKDVRLRQQRHDGDDSLLVAQKTFDDRRFLIEDEYEVTGFVGFWKKVYPDQARLVESYILEAFDTIGYNVADLAQGERLPDMPKILTKHNHLVRRMFEILEDGNFVQTEDDSFVRTAKKASSESASSLLQSMLLKHPQHAAEMNLLNASASRLEETLTGKLDPLQLLFANKANRDVMAEVYAKAPMCLAATRLLADFIATSLAAATQRSHTWRLIEVGAGTGGTAKYLVNHLRQHGVRFEYTFTDISSALVSQAKKAFGNHDNTVQFMTLDCDRSPPDELCQKFDVVIATNCIHATNNAASSSSNIAKLLRKDGFFAMCEFTRGIYWFDLVYGLLEGWWKFGDGRKHALANQWFWNDTLRTAGFKHVSWTDGNSQEAQTMRVICGFLAEPLSPAFRPMPRGVIKRAGIFAETFTWKTVGNLELQADVYYPKQPDAPNVHRPVALMIHGGGHLLFGRHDIPMKHVRTLLKRGFLPVSVDYRLCPEMSLFDGPVTDCCDALQWVREKLPTLTLGDLRVSIMPGVVLALGWSSGGQLAMTLGYTAKARGIEPPNVILPFYSPSDLEASFWSEPIYPEAAEEAPQEIWGVLDCVRREPILDYAPASNKAATGLSLTIKDDRARLILHMNWTAQSVPVLIRGLPHKDDVSPNDTYDWKKLPMPPAEKIRPCSPYFHIIEGTYTTPTFMVHGNVDDWIPYQMTQKTIQALKERGVECGILIPDQCGHAFDLFPREDRLGVGWQAIEAAYDFACKQLHMYQDTM